MIILTAFVCMVFSLHLAQQAYTAALFEACANEEDCSKTDSISHCLEGVCKCRPEYFYTTCIVKPINASMDCASVKYGIEFKSATCLLDQTGVSTMFAGSTADEQYAASRKLFEDFVDPLMVSWKILNSTSKTEDRTASSPTQERIENCAEEIREQLWILSEGILKVVEETFIPEAATGYSKVLYYTMKGDLYKIMAEIYSGQMRTGVTELALIAYKAANDIALTELPPANPIRLNLALSFSLYYSEILNSTHLACRAARCAFDNAIFELDTLSEENYKESTSIMQRLRDQILVPKCGFPLDEN